MTTMEHITFNVTPAGCRHEKLDDREYLVVPMVMLTEGVHAGSGGPLYYPAEELSKTPAVWNTKPIVVYHPEINGRGVSACDPVILEARSVGMILNTKWDGKLRAEAWLDKKKVDKVDKRIMKAVTANSMMELSTGLFSDKEEIQGKWNTEEYGGIARNYRPDHLALLPDRLGACSIADGAGFLRLNESQSENAVDLLQDVLDRNSGGFWRGEVGTKLRGRVERFVELLSNEFSHREIRGLLFTAMQERFGDTAWIDEVFDDFFVYERDGKLWRLSYSQTDSGVTLGDSPEAVMRKISFEPVTNREDEMATNATKDKLVTDLIAHKGTQWTDEDKDFLSGLEEARLQKLMPVVTNDKPPKDEEREEEEALRQLQGQQPPASPVTLAQYIQNAPPEYQDVLISGLESHNAERQRLISVITANEQNILTEDQLKKMKLPELKAIAALARKPAPTGGTPSWQGADAGEPIINQHNEEGLPVPRLTFGKK